jgi:hypothetical protein
MAISLLGPLNKVINDTTTQIVDSEIPTKVSQVLTTLVTSSFSVVDDLLKQVQELTRETPKTAPRSKPRKNQP